MVCYQSVLGGAARGALHATAVRDVSQEKNVDLKSVTIINIKIVKLTIMITATIIVIRPPPKTS